MGSDQLGLQYVALCCATLMIGWLLHWVYRWVNPPCIVGKLPPGSMGFPVVGETFQLFKASPSIDIPSYYRDRLKRYGPVFKTNLVGQPLVFSLDPEFNRLIFQQEGKLFRSWYPETANNIFGKKSITTYSGTVHKFIRSFSSKLFGAESLREVLIGELENAMRQGFPSWAARPSIEVKDSVADMIFDLVAKKMISIELVESRELKKNFEDFVSQYTSLGHHLQVHEEFVLTMDSCMKGTKKVHEKLTGLLQDRLRTPGNFATISATLTIGLKLLTDNPKVVETLKEHEEILKQRGNKNSGFTWDEYRSLAFTTQVMNEINRMSNIAPGIFRKTLKDVQVNGCTIPAGWLVMISPMAVHLNPTLFEDPLRFNPWRWMTHDETKRSMQQRNFMPFGGGIRLCLGAEFSKLFISLFLHVLVTKYRYSICVLIWLFEQISDSCAILMVCRWIEIKGEVLRVAEMIIPQGYHIQIVPTTE
ncbi:hypothetical protein C2845_PM13G19280 [Panicum miliaceum]|uniref:Cytochrome P450 87A3-like n=1 Tax=Panicum miliaceum TaxID=4540 RepID=A0A3L6RK75_PANMI|nr:hypothetical protein C2845_PM13G19280 [Panicum miliaceum]